MLEPNIPLLRRFVQLEEVTTVVERSEMATRRLDDLLPEIPGGGVESWHILALNMLFFLGISRLINGVFCSNYCGIYVSLILQLKNQEIFKRINGSRHFP